MTQIEETESNKEIPLEYKLAAKLLQADWKKILLAILCCSLPQLLLSYFTQVNLPGFWSMLLNSSLELFFLFHLLNPHLANFGSAYCKKNNVIKLVLTGLGYWLIVRSPFIALNLLPHNNYTTSLSLILIIPAISIGLTYFYYFFPICAGIENIKDALDEARWINKQDPYSPFKTLIPSFAIYFLLSNLVSCFSPDGRSLNVMLFQIIVAELPFFIMSYLAFAICIKLIDGKRWHEYGFTAYKEARIETLLASAPQELVKLLTPKISLSILLISALLAYSNLIQVYNTMPSPSITTDEILVKENGLNLKLTLEDPVYRFRSFQPYAYKLAGPKGTAVNTELPNADIQTNSDYTVSKLNLEFKTEMSKAELMQLTDLYLWYFNVKLLKLETKQ
ncbi:MAG: hypothetical protein KDD56_07255 [Bdellovibrionales bacterium]|nr:hypothetical protein [Bdellovibrionales bacterium]